MGTVTFCSTHKPAKMSALEFPCRAFLLYCTEFLFPTRGKSCLSSTLINQQEKDLPLDMARNCPPALLIAVYCFKGSSKELRQFFLRFIKFFSSNAEFFFGQGMPLHVSLLI